MSDSDARSKTRTPHRLVTESGDPETIETHYAMHARAAEKAAEGDLVTDGGVDQSEAGDDQPETLCGDPDCPVCSDPDRGACADGFCNLIDAVNGDSDV